MVAGMSGMLFCNQPRGPIQAHALKALGRLRGTTAAKNRTPCTRRGARPDNSVLLAGVPERLRPVLGKKPLLHKLDNGTVPKLQK